MASKYGASRGEPQYDRFRTGLTFAEVRRMLGRNDEIADLRERHNRRRRNGVLGFWHEMKLELYRRAYPETEL